MNRSRNPLRGSGAARAKQMGLLLDLSPGGGMEDGGNEEDLEAELLALMGDGGGKSTPNKHGGKAPVPMAEIERMAALCMKDLDDEEDLGDEDLDDEDLLAELNEVLEDEEETPKSALPATVVAPPKPSSAPTAPSCESGPEARLLERIAMYQTAVDNAKSSGESSKARRYERGLKTLQSILASVKKGKPINEEEMPPPVATGGKPNVPPVQPEPIKERHQPAPNLMPSPPANQKPLREAPPPVIPNAKAHFLSPPKTPSGAITPDTPAISPLTPCQPDSQHSELKQAVLSRQREYKIAAIHAKQGGDSELAKQHYLIAKKLDPVVEALDRGESLDLRSLPPPPGDAVKESSAPAPSQASSRAVPALVPSPAPVASADLAVPGSVAEALQQRMDKYKTAAETAKSNGDDRKSRMHQRIVKQYQDSIKANKAGRQVNLADLPVPPGCPPLPGLKADVLETAMKLANQDTDAEVQEEEGSRADVAKPVARPQAPKAAAAPQAPAKLGSKAQQQLDFLLLRRQGFTNAALRSKHMKDMVGATQHLRNAKGLDSMINATKAGLPVDISKIPEPPVSEEDFSLGRSRTSPLSARSSQQYQQLMDLLRKQHEKCRGYCQQFTQLGNVGETLKFERLSDECMKSIDMVKNAHAKGQPVPKARQEERTFNVVKVNPNLTLNEMKLFVIRGINLPTPSGVSSSELDSSVKFEFLFPSAEEAQRDRTATVKSTNSPEFKEQFMLNISRGQRAFKRVVQTKGIKFEILHKGGLFKTDKVVGSAQLKLEALENHCEIREIVEVLDGRKSTGGKLEVSVMIREPLSGAQLQPVVEKWLVLEASPSPKNIQKERAPSPRSRPRSEAGHRGHPSSSPPPQYKLHSFSLLHHDKENLERRLGEYKRTRRDPPTDLLHKHREVTHRLQWQKAYLEKGSLALLAGNTHTHTHTHTQ
ncbi:hypothetical protein NHX12_018130 [Muraenolepis orangiensis]|uniref:Coiled-coil and C2 domain-containing protein 1B n=1 Tax=Muraenolepis orangiensis TaxID=630683 RepID=A0A9Q0EXS4_9TELE|nr:hypothetical protein NHX12_018130 [Muraenolepis orangiensis]